MKKFLYNDAAERFSSIINIDHIESIYPEFSGGKYRITVVGVSGKTYTIMEFNDEKSSLLAMEYIGGHLLRESASWNNTNVYIRTSDIFREVQQAKEIEDREK